MYFWNLRGLKSRMAERPLTDREVLPYLVVCNSIIAAVYSLALLPFNRWDALGVIWSVALAIGGTLYVYRCNGGAGGEQFLQRGLVIGWVVAIRWGVALIVASIPLYVGLEIFGEISDETTWYEFLMFAVWELIVYERVAHHVGDVAQRTVHSLEASA